MIVRRIIRSGLVAALALGLVATAGAGGDTIANAPELPLGQLQNVSSERSDIWRVTLKVNDVVALDFGALAGSRQIVNVCVLAPEVTDYTAAKSPCIVHAETAARSQLTMAARKSGPYTIVVSNESCLDDNGRNGAAVGCGDRIQYELTGSVRHATQVNIAAPSLVRAGSAFALRGTVAGASGGKVLVEARRGAKSAPWKTLAIAPLGKAGAFALKTRLAPAGSYQLRVTYPGDTGHLPSAASRSVRVA
jgi:hypothetical protein